MVKYTRVPHCHLWLWCEYCSAIIHLLFIRSRWGRDVYLWQLEMQQITDNCQVITWKTPSHPLEWRMNQNGEWICQLSSKLLIQTQMSNVLLGSERYSLMTATSLKQQRSTIMSLLYYKVYECVSYHDTADYFFLCGKLFSVIWIALHF